MAPNATVKWRGQNAGIARKMRHHFNKTQVTSKQVSCWFGKSTFCRAVLIPLKTWGLPELYSLFGVQWGWASVQYRNRYAGKSLQHSPREGGVSHGMSQRSSTYFWLYNCPRSASAENNALPFSHRIARLEKTLDSQSYASLSTSVSGSS